MISQSTLQSRLTELAAELKVPGAAFAVACGEETAVAWTGTANLRTGLPVQRDSLFAAGSVTKVFTAALVMTLVDDDLVDLDGPVRKYVPELTIPGADDITVRMLLNHTSGLPGYATFRLPRGPEVVQRFVELLSTFELNSPPGRYWSYSNGGLLVAGRVAEVVTALPFDDALEQRVLRPLGLNATSALDELLLRPAAVGHVVDADGAVAVTPRLQLGTNAPSGSALYSDIDGLIAFGRMHLRQGRAADGRQVLSPEAVAAMQAPGAPLPFGMGYEEMGLGWLRRSTAAGPLLAHTGASAGQHSSLTVLPERQAVIAALTNSTMGAALYTTLQTELLREEFGVAPTAPPVAPRDITVDLAPLTGTYTSDEGQVVVAEVGGRLQVAHVVGDDFADVMRLIMGPVGFPPPPFAASPVDTDGHFIGDNGMAVEFVTEPGHVRPAFAYVGRLYRRIE